jgi:hypothetical protein
MILYDLICTKEHRFESWFRNSTVVEKLIKAGEVACPACGSRKVQKAPMAPRLGKSATAVAAPAKLANASSGELSAAMAKAVEAFAELRQAIEKNFEHVGDKFPDEARRIHYGEAPKRGIYGDATRAETQELLEEGIEVSVIPWKRRTNS